MEMEGTAIPRKFYIIGAGVLVLLLLIFAISRKGNVAARLAARKDRLAIKASKVDFRNTKKECKRRCSGYGIFQRTAKRNCLNSCYNAIKT